MKIAKPTISKTIEFLICISFLSLTFRHEISSICLYLTGFLSIIELTRRKTNYFDKNKIYKIINNYKRNKEVKKNSNIIFRLYCFSKMLFDIKY